ncbi:hypothetical protein JQ633_08110 [Bradyrhizobium tropiciagri]|uniref:hypothetical protein n=1 Tax=Bradyrhizobium tropiciagri TaxID=312253 RepID=UPI001BA8E51B|nr:hypothetical protein [Bradyrhizobium tropiciagri]MBR0870316.1 hypothetical protein [Bradyrhizobium tropiciagri]
MLRLIVCSLVAASLMALAVPPFASAQQQPGARPVNAQKLEKCKQLARERGFQGGGFTKGAIKPRDFIIACMQGKVT